MNAAEIARDALDAGMLNGLPQPLFVNVSGWWWPVESIDVETGLMRIDVSGQLDLLHFVEAHVLRDADGVEHDPDNFWTDAPHN